MVLNKQGIHLPYNGCFKLIYLKSGPLGVSPTDEAIAIRRMAANHGSLFCPVEFAPARTLGNLGPFILGDGALHVQKQLALGSFFHRPFEKYDLHAAVMKFVYQDHEFRTTGQPIGTLDVNSIDIALPHKVSESVETRSHKVVSGISLVYELLALRGTIFFDPGPEFRQLALACVFLFLPIGAYPCIHG